jgi:hypothetical protein
MQLAGRVNRERGLILVMPDRVRRSRIARSGIQRKTHEVPLIRSDAPET